MPAVIAAIFHCGWKIPVLKTQANPALAWRSGDGASMREQSEGEQ